MNQNKPPTPVTSLAYARAQRRKHNLRVNSTVETRLQRLEEDVEQLVVLFVDLEARQDSASRLLRGLLTRLKKLVGNLNQPPPGTGPEAA